MSKSISYIPDKSIICKSFREGKNIRVIMGEKPATLLNINEIAQFFHISPTEVKLSDVLKQMPGHVTLSLP